LVEQILRGIEMRESKNHTSKNFNEKESYRRYIKQTDYEPTVDETLKFNSTDEQQKGLAQTTAGYRGISLHTSVTNHLKEHWGEYLIAFLLIIMSYFMYESKIDINGINIKVNSIEDDVKELKTEQKELNQKNHEQDLKIQKNDLKIEEIDKAQMK
jgi:hypothetical protein